MDTVTSRHSGGASPADRPRAIVARTRGRGHGPVVRLMSPSDLGELLKPFVFLDYVDAKDHTKPKGSDYGLHPHSGIATLTWLFEGEVDYEDTTGRRGRISAGHVEWFRAGGGGWHGGRFGDDDAPVRGFQLWVALPPQFEQAAAESLYLAPHQLPNFGPATVLLGRYQSVASPIEPPSPITYVAVRLLAGEQWRYQPPQGHDVAWTAVSAGRLRVPDGLRGGDLVAFDESEDPIRFVAETDVEFVVGSAARHPHELVLGNYSVHTSVAALNEGEGRIRRIGRSLQAAGRLR